jgi:hypothetical protein
MNGFKFSVRFSASEVENSAGPSLCVKTIDLKTVLAVLKQ